MKVRAESHKFKDEFRSIFADLPLKDIVFFPPYAMKYFAISLCFLLLTMTVIDRVVLDWLETRGLLISTDWEKQTTNAANMLLERNYATFESPIWRSDAYKISAAKTHSRRILVMGDSFVWGHGLLNMNHTWWRQLQAELDRNAYDVDVIAAGLCGANTRRELGWAQILIKEYKPDMIIWSYVINDPTEDDKKTGLPIVKNRYRESKSHKGLFYYGPPNYEGVAGFFHTFWPRLVRYLDSRRTFNYSRATSNEETGWEWSMWEMKLLEGRNFEQYKDTLKETSEFIHNSGVPQFFMMMVFPTPKKFQERMWPVERLFYQDKIEYLDVLPQMTRWYQSRFANVPGVPEFVLGATPTDAHPGPIINHYYAEQALAYLEKEHPDVLGRKNGSSEMEKDKHQYVFNDWAPISMNLRMLSSNSFTIDYPKETDKLFLMPFHRWYAQCNFEHPVQFKSIKVRGNGLKSCKLILAGDDPARHEYMLGHYLDLGEKQGKEMEFVVSNADFDISEIKIMADFSSEDRKMIFELN